MSLAEEMLATMSASDESVSYLADEEPHIIIDGTRKIIVPNALKLIAVQGDKDIETVTFDCVRYWDGNDLSSFAIYINYILPNKAEGTYIPQNVTRFDDIFSFEWKIGKEITHTKGSLTFWIVAKLTNDDADVIKQWSSLQNSECTIAQGGDKTYVPESQTDKDVISQVLSVSQASALRAEEAAISAENRYELVRDLTGSVVELSGNALRDAKRAEAAAEQSAVKADSSLLSAQNALQSERAAMEYESRARSSAESAARAATHAEAVVAGVNEKIERNSKRITNLEQGLPSEQFMTDSTVAHVKDVPVNALPFAEVSKVGGMTRKCTNLLPYPYAETTKTLNGITFTDNGDGSITVNGTSTGVAAFEFSTDRTLFKVGRTYTINGTVGDVTVDVLFSGVTWGGKGTFTVTEAMMNASNIAIQIRIISGITLNNVTVIPMLNEGSTALPYEPYFEGLRDAKVTEIESVGANLFDAKNISSSVQYATVSLSGDDVIVEGTYYASFSINLKANMKYSISYGANGNIIQVSLKYKSGVLSQALTQKQTFIPLEDVVEIYLYAGHGDTNKTTYSNFIISEGDTIKPYRPYTKNSLPIPEAVQVLDGYGWGVNADCYNYVDWEKKQFVKRVGAVDMGTLDWSPDFVGFSSNLSDVKTPNYAEKPNILASSYNVVGGIGASDLSAMADKAITINYALPILYAKDSAYTDVTAFKAAMQGVMLVYELETPIITDISDLLSADNFLAVEGGGTVTAVNENGLEAPSEITYMLKETTV